MGRALLVVDVQVDFCEDGSLPVSGGTQVARDVAELLQARRGSYDLVVASADWHVDPGAHFGDPPDFVDTWPAHCVVGTRGAQLQEPLSEQMFDAVVRKGEHAAAYSAFDGTTEGVPLAQWLRRHEVDDLEVCGIATDHCVRATALDAMGNGFSTRVLLNLTAGVTDGTTDAAIEELRTAGVELEGEVLRA